MYIDNIRLKITDLNGETVFSSVDYSLINNPDITSGLPSGSYEVDINYGGQVKTLKLQKLNTEEVSHN